MNAKRYCSVILCTAFAAQSAEKVPDIALLEYLAELVEVDGELVGPMDMANKVETEQNEKKSGSAQNTQPPIPKQPNKLEDKKYD